MTNMFLPHVVDVVTTGWNGNQIVAGALLQTTRNAVTHACNRRFDKFTTLCTEQKVVYDEDTGEAVVVSTTSGGLLPYGVDAVFLADSSAYDDTLTVGEHLQPDLLDLCNTPLLSWRP